MLTADDIETLEMIEAGATGDVVPRQDDPLWHRTDCELRLSLAGAIEGRRITPTGRALLGRMRVPAP